MNNKKEKKSLGTILNENHKKEFPHIVSGNECDESSVRCKICDVKFSIYYGGRSKIVQHNNTASHKSNLKCQSSSSQIQTFFKKTSFDSSEKHLALSELVFAYHTVVHSQSFRSMDCTSSIIQKLFEKKFTCSRTKCTAIVNKVI